MTESDTHDPFGDIELDEGAILGTHTYDDVLYSERQAREMVPVDVRTGEKTRPIPSADEARAFAEYTVRDGGRARVAVVQDTERMIESQSVPYISTVYFDAKVVRGKPVSTDEYGQPEYPNDGRALERAYRAAAIESDDHEVVLEGADYETGAVTITVRRI